MYKYQIEIGEKLNAVLEEGARMKDMAIERFIAEILNRYAVDPHIMEKEDVKEGYEESGDINLDWSNL